MNDLETLRSLILAAKADGDDETADWLETLQTPEEIAAFVRPVQTEQKGGEGEPAKLSDSSSSSFQGRS